MEYFLPICQLFYSKEIKIVYNFFKNNLSFVYKSPIRYRRMKILVIDDDQKILKSFKRSLSDEFVIDVASNGQEAEYLAYNNYYEVIILDLILPDVDGEDLARIFKKRIPDVPIIAVTGKHAVSDKQFAFDNGVDDYIVKPVSIRELKSRLKALIRRRPESISKVSENIQIRKLKFDRVKKMVFYDGVWVRLRKKEMQLLEFLMVNKHRVISRDDILENVWDSDTDPFTNTVDVHIKRLRLKIEDPFKEKFIHTIHGLGYIFQ